jgi:SAM-dependent methyltransferase
MNELEPMDIWNLPASANNNDLQLTRCYHEIAKSRAVRILEIGVFRANAIQRFYDAKIDIVSYVGVDPYLGNEQDYYLDMYWKNSTESETCYSHAKKVFELYGQTLVRQTSDDFFAANIEQFDIIFVDGDHSYSQTLKDLNNALGCLNPGGVLIVDDYANVGHPDVTKAVDEFLGLNRAKFSQLGRLVLEFQPKGALIPISLTQVLMRSLVKDNSR